MSDKAAKKAKARRERYYIQAAAQQDQARSRAHELLCDLLCAKLGGDEWSDKVEREIEEAVDSIVKAAAATVQMRACAAVQDPDDPATSALLSGQAGFGLASALTLLLVSKGVVTDQEASGMKSEAVELALKNLKRAHGIRISGSVCGPFNPEKAARPEEKL